MTSPDTKPFGRIQARCRQRKEWPSRSTRSFCFSYLSQPSFGGIQSQHEWDPSSLSKHIYQYPEKSSCTNQYFQLRKLDAQCLGFTMPRCSYYLNISIGLT